MPMTYCGDQTPNARNPTEVGCEKTSSPQDKAAAIKSFILLSEQIGPESMMELLALGYFTVAGSYGEYEIKRSGRVTLSQKVKIGVKSRPLRWSLCIAPEPSGRLKEVFQKPERRLNRRLTK